ncbi:MAG: DUF3822 family protein [Flavobacteriaceae bacterium]|nr:DUF3822 family protein [Flavobacteriaceae bacterium]
MTITKNKEHKLSIQLGLNGFSFLVYNTQKEEVIQEKEVQYNGETPYLDWLKVKLASKETFRQEFSSTNLLFAPEKYTLVPNSLFEKEKIASLFSVSHPIEETEKILFEQTKEHTILYAIPHNMQEVMEDFFPKYKQKTVPYFLLKNAQNTKKWNVVFFIDYKKIYVAVFKENTIILSNSFQFQTKDDLLYYMLYIFDNFEIAIEQSTMQLWGHLAYCEMLKEKLSRYHNDICISAKNAYFSPKTNWGNILLSNI